MRQRLETRLKSNLAHAKIPVEQKIFRPLGAHPCQVIGKINTRGLFEDFAKIKFARVDCLVILAFFLFNQFCPGESKMRKAGETNNWESA